MVRIPLIIPSHSDAPWFFRCLDMAELFPHADILGIDRHVNGIAPSLDIVPRNCRFDTRLDYEFLTEEEFLDFYDVIHMRYVAGGVSALSGYFASHI